MDARRVRQGKALMLHAGRKMLGKSPEIICGWSGKAIAVKLALMIFMGLFVLVLPLSLTCTEPLRQRLIDFSTLAARGKTTEVVRSKQDATLGGLLPLPELFKNKCISRLQEYSFRRSSPHTPSPYLITKLREYERRHCNCVQEVKKFNPTKNATEQDFGECRFVVWIASSGLGNRIMTLASAFVYAVLTNRVLLIDRSGDPDELFCEPFPDTSWLLPESFPSHWMKALNSSSSNKFGSLTRNHTFKSSHNGHAYLHLMHDYDDDDRKFFCAQCQTYLSSFPWLFMRSNQYFIPGLHFVSEFHTELDKLFPERETVFHHIIRYLLHPSDSVWRMISRFYDTNLASVQRKVGLQIRVFKTNFTFPTITNLVLSCALENNLLPNVTMSQDHGIAHKTNSTSVLIASLHKIFYETIRGFYQNHTTTDDQQLSVYTASHEEEQFMKSTNHDRKALADMYLLSFSDTLLTSSWSTFGYVAEGISGVKPWIFTKLDDPATAEQIIRKQGYCNRGKSIEPCFHSAPVLDCDNKGWGIDPGKTHPYIQHCEDVWWGIKIMDNNSLTS